MTTPKHRARHAVWKQVRNNITNPRKIAKKTNLKKAIIKRVLKDLQREKLLETVKNEYRIRTRK